MIKVAIITNNFPPSIGGIENHCFNLAKHLSKVGIVVEVHTKGRGIEDFCYDVGKCFKVYRHMFFQLYLPRGIDIIHLHNFNVLPHMLIFTLIALRKILHLSRPKIIITLHGGYTPWWKGFKIPIKLLKLIYHKTLGKFFLNYVVDKIIALNYWEKVQLLNEGIDERKIVIVSNAIEDLAFETPCCAVNREAPLNIIKPNILFLGRISPEKAIHRIILWMKNVDNVKFVIAGPINDREYYAKLRHLVKRLGLNTRVIFRSKVHGCEKYLLIDNALALVIPSEFETDPLVVKEALVRGKAIIVSSKTVLINIINELKRLRKILCMKPKICFAQDVQSFINCLKNFSRIAHNDICRKNNVKEWRWHYVIKSILKAYGSG